MRDLREMLSARSSSTEIQETTPVTRPTQAQVAASQQHQRQLLHMQQQRVVGSNMPSATALTNSAKTSTSAPLSVPLSSSLMQKSKVPEAKEYLTRVVEGHGGAPVHLGIAAQSSAPAKNNAGTIRLPADNDFTFARVTLKLLFFIQNCKVISSGRLLFAIYLCIVPIALRESDIRV